MSSSMLLLNTASRARISDLLIKNLRPVDFFAMVVSLLARIIAYEKPLRKLLCATQALFRIGNHESKHDPGKKTHTEDDKEH